MTSREVREAAADALHLPGHPTDDTLIRGLFALVERDEAQARETRRQTELAGATGPGGWER